MNCDASFKSTDGDARKVMTPLRASNHRCASALQGHGEMRIGIRGRQFFRFVALAAVLCAGCDTTPPIGGEQPPIRHGERRDQFMCRDGVPIELSAFESQGVAVLTRHGRTVQLKLQSTESGDIFSNGPTTVRRKGRDLRLEMEGMEPIECRSQSDG